MKIEFDFRLFLFLCLGFIIFTPIGTLTHELGHYIMAKYLGYNAEIDYAHTYYYPVYSAKRISLSDEKIITLAGPIQTILTGTLGVLILFYKRKDYMYSKKISLAEWSIIFFSLFWLRQPMNFLMYCIKRVFNSNYKSNGDEFCLAEYFGLPYYSISLITAIIGVGVLYFVVFKIIPIELRATFITSLILGGIFGYLIWLHWLGKFILP